MAQHRSKQAIVTRVAITAEEAEVAYSIPRGTLANLRCRREGPVFFKVGSRCYYKVAGFEEWFFSKRVLTKDAVSSRMGG